MPAGARDDRHGVHGLRVRRRGRAAPDGAHAVGGGDRDEDRVHRQRDLGFLPPELGDAVEAQFASAPVWRRVEPVSGLSDGSNLKPLGRADHSLTVLENGKVLLYGGKRGAGGGSSVRSTESIL